MAQFEFLGGGANRARRSLYAVADGHVDLPDVPGFGLALDEGVFQAAVVAEDGVVARA